MPAEAGSSRVRSNCLMVAGSRDVPIPKAPCLPYRVPGVRKTPSNPPPRKSLGPPNGVALLHRAGWCSPSRSANEERLDQPLQLLLALGQSQSLRALVSSAADLSPLAAMGDQVRAAGYSLFVYDPR